MYSFYFSKRKKLQGGRSGKAKGPGSITDSKITKMILKRFQIFDVGIAKSETKVEIIISRGIVKTKAAEVIGI